MPKRTVGRGAIGLLCSGLLGVLLFSPAAASAKRIFDIKHRSVSARMWAPASHGYWIEIENVGRNRLRLSATRGDILSLLFEGAPAVAAEYTVPGRVTRDRIKANFGRLGLVSVRFHRVGRPHFAGTTGSLRCKGHGPVREHGRFEGTIRFRGEQGFTRLRQKAAPGTVVRRFKRTCHFHSGGHRETAQAAANKLRHKLRATVLGAEERRAGRTTLLESFSLEAPDRHGKEGGSLTFVAAKLTDHRGRIAIEKNAEVIGDQGTLLASSPGVVPATTTMVLASPFYGTGLYRDESPPSWTGSLSVHLPGATVPLTGPRFTAVLCRETSLAQAERCLSKVTKAATSAQRSSRLLGLKLFGP